MVIDILLLFLIRVLINFRCHVLVLVLVLAITIIVIHLLVIILLSENIALIQIQILMNLIYLILVVFSVVFLVLVLLKLVNQVLFLIGKSKHANLAISLVFKLTRVLILFKLGVRTTIMEPDMGLYSRIPKYFTACRASNLLVFMTFFNMILHIPAFLITHFTIDGCQIGIRVINYPIANVLFLPILVSNLFPIFI